MNYDEIHLDLPANLKFLNVLSACIAAMLERVEGLDEPNVMLYNLQLAVHETATNIVRHAYANLPDGHIKVKLAMHSLPERFVVEMVDTGRSFNPDDVPDPNLDVAQESGLGLFLMRELMDEVSYCSKPDHNHWRLVKNL